MAKDQKDQHQKSIIFLVLLVSAFLFTFLLVFALTGNDPLRITNVSQQAQSNEDRVGLIQEYLKTAQEAVSDIKEVVGAEPVGFFPSFKVHAETVELSEEDKVELQRLIDIYTENIEKVNLLILQLQENEFDNEILSLIEDLSVLVEDLETELDSVLEDIDSTEAIYDSIEDAVELTEELDEEIVGLLIDINEESDSFLKDEVIDSIEEAESLMSDINEQMDEEELNFPTQEEELFVQGLINSGDDALALAKVNVVEGNYLAAYKNVTKALELYGDVVQYLDVFSEDLGDDQVDAVRDILEEAKELILEAEEVLVEEENQLDPEVMEEVKGLLVAAKDYLSQAENALESGDFVSAIELGNLAEELASKANQSLDYDFSIDDESRDDAIDYLEEARGIVLDVEDEILDAKQDIANQENAEKALNLAKTKLTDAEAAFDRNEYLASVAFAKEVIFNAELAESFISYSIDDENMERAGDLIDDLKGDLFDVEEEVRDAKEDVWNQSVAENLLNKAKAKLASAEKAYEKGEYTSAIRLVKEGMKLLEDAEENISYEGGSDVENIDQEEEEDDDESELKGEAFDLLSDARGLVFELQREIKSAKEDVANQTKATNLLNQAKGKLTDADAAYQRGDYSTTIKLSREILSMRGSIENSINYGSAGGGSVAGVSTGFDNRLEINSVVIVGLGIFGFSTMASLYLLVVGNKNSAKD